MKLDWYNFTLIVIYASICLFIDFLSPSVSLSSLHSYMPINFYLRGFVLIFLNLGKEIELVCYNLLLVLYASICLFINSFSLFQSPSFSLYIYVYLSTFTYSYLLSFFWKVIPVVCLSLYIVMYIYIIYL